MPPILACRATGSNRFPSRIRTRLHPTLVLTALATLLPPGCGGSEKPAVESVRPVRAIQVPDPTDATHREFTGRARAARRSELSFEVPGRILERPVDVGDQVRAGDLVAALDPRDYDNALRAARARRKQAQALYERVVDAHVVKAVSDQDLTDAETRLREAEADVRLRAKALEDTRIVAPHDGEITAAYVERFQVVGEKEPVLRLLDTSHIEIVVEVPENLIDLVPYVVDTKVRFDALPDVLLGARISEVGREASAVTRMYPVTLLVEIPDGVEIEAGMTGRATGRIALLEGQPNPPLVVPASAVVQGDGGASFVWVVDATTKKVTRRAVKLGARSDRGVAVEAGVKPFEWIATAGAQSLTEGQPVEILDVSHDQWRLPMPTGRSVPVRDATVSSLEN
jgi:RND family efflux transporter MFP subunit